VSCATHLFCESYALSKCHSRPLYEGRASKRDILIEICRRQGFRITLQAMKKRSLRAIVVPGIGLPCH
jgi:hypothetical protein